MSAQFGQRALLKWVERHMPELFSQLWLLDTDDVRARLNQITGLSVLSTDLIEESSDRFLEALKQMESKS